MSEDNRSGIFEGLVLGAGFAGLLMLPVILMRRFGVMVMSFVAATGMTGLVLLRPSMLEWLSEEQNQCQARTCPADVLHGLMTALPTWGFWMVVIGAWVIVLLRVWLESTSKHAQEVSQQ